MRGCTQRAGPQGKRVQYVYEAQAHGTATKKKSLQAAERDSPRIKQARQEFSHTIFKLDPKRLKVIDETGVNLSMTRLYGRAPKGERVVGSVPDDHGPNVTVVGAMGLEDISAAMSFEGPMNGSVFKLFVEEVLGPTLVEGDVVVMDNLPAHKVRGIEQAIESRGASLVYLPPYSPDFSPIEQCWSKVKTWLKKAKAPDREALDRAVVDALGEVTKSDAIAWFQHCGYAVHSP